MTSGPLASLPADSPSRALFAYLGENYGYSEEQLARAAGRHLVGGQLSAVDIHWAATCGFVDPMPEDRCPMATDFRHPHLYGTVNDDIDRALTARLRAHRDFIYETQLQLPIVF